MFDEIKARIPANKFYPPRFDASQYLYRKDLVETMLERNGRSVKGVQIIAQAGQGKTTLASQFLNQCKMPYAWYQVGTEDGDPILFVTSLLSCLLDSLPGFSSPLLEEMIADGELSVLDLARAGNILLGDLSGYLLNELYIIFDDLHLIEKDQATNSFLAHLIDTSPPQLHFLLASRRPLNIEAKTIKYGRDMIHLDNRALALSEIESRDLFSRLCKKQIPRETINKIHHSTDGWMMGLVLASHAFEYHGTTDIRYTSRIAATGEELLDYFNEEIFSQIPGDMRRPLLKLSFLEDIPVPLATEMTGMDDIRERLVALQKQNFFVRSLDNDDMIFSFHHLFQDFLQAKAEHELGMEEKIAVLEKAASYCLSQERIPSALRYYLRAADYSTIEAILQEHGMVLLGMNRNATLLNILSSVPQEISNERGWLALFIAMAQFDIAPEKSFAILEKARESFARDNVFEGELISLAQLLYYYGISSGNFIEGARLLPRTIELFEKFGHTLPLHAKVLVAKNISFASLFFKTNLAKAVQYSSLAMELAEKNRLINFIASILFCQGFEYMFQSQHQDYMKIQEKAYGLILDPHIGTVNKLSLCYMFFESLGTLGDFENCRRHESLLVDMIGREVIKNTIFGPFIYIGNTIMLIAENRLEDALRLAREGFDSGPASLNAHLRSQFLMWQAFLYALLGKKTKAVQAAQEAMKLRNEAGGQLFVVLTQYIIGAVFAQIGMLAEADALLKEAIEGADEARYAHYFPAVHLIRAFLRLKTGNHAGALEDMRQGLKLMKKNKLMFFYGWTSKIMLALLSVAVKEDIEKEFARRLAAERHNVALLDDGSAIPLLQIQTLGDFTISVDDTVILKTEDLTPSQRHLLSLIISSPEQRISQEKIQLCLWPDSPPDKARKKFDTLLSRLRKILSQAIDPHPIKEYLFLQKGIIGLENCLIDAVDFVKKSQKGLQHASRREWWQAGNCFHSAMNLWKGCFASDIFGDDQVQDFCVDLRRLLADISSKWGDNLAELGHLEEAVDVIKRALDADQTNHDLVKKLYITHLQNGNTIQAQQVIKQYETLLQREDYLSEEIKELLADITSN